MKELGISRTHDNDIVIEVSDDGRLMASGSGANVEDAAGWVLHHLQRHLDETRDFLGRLGIVPTSGAVLREMPMRKEPKR